MNNFIKNLEKLPESEGEEVCEAFSNILKPGIIDSSELNEAVKNQLGVLQRFSSKLSVSEKLAEDPKMPPKPSSKQQTLDRWIITNKTSPHLENSRGAVGPISEDHVNDCGDENVEKSPSSAMVNFPSECIVEEKVKKQLKEVVILLERTNLNEYVTSRKAKSTDGLQLAVDDNMPSNVNSEKALGSATASEASFGKRKEELQLPSFELVEIEERERKCKLINCDVEPQITVDSISTIVTDGSVEENNARLNSEPTDTGKEISSTPKCVVKRKKTRRRKPKNLKPVENDHAYCATKVTSEDSSSYQTVDSSRICESEQFATPVVEVSDDLNYSSNTDGSPNKKGKDMFGESSSPLDMLAILAVESSNQITTTPTKLVSDTEAQQSLSLNLSVSSHKTTSSLSKSISKRDNKRTQPTLHPISDIKSSHVDNTPTNKIVSLKVKSLCPDAIPSTSSLNISSPASKPLTRREGRANILPQPELNLMSQPKVTRSSSVECSKKTFKKMNLIPSAIARAKRLEKDMTPEVEQKNSEAFIKLTELCATLGVEVQDLFKRKEMQKIIERNRSLPNSVFFLGSNKDEKTGKIQPYVSTHEDKYELEKTIMDLKEEVEENSEKETKVSQNIAGVIPEGKVTPKELKSKKKPENEVVIPETPAAEQTEACVRQNRNTGAIPKTKKNARGARKGGDCVTRDNTEKSQP